MLTKILYYNADRWLNGVIEFIFFLLTCYSLCVFFLPFSIFLTVVLPKTHTHVPCLFFVSLFSTYTQNWTLFITIASQVQSVVFFVVNTKHFNDNICVHKQAEGVERTKESKLVLFNIRIQFFTIFSWENFVPKHYASVFL